MKKKRTIAFIAVALAILIPLSFAHASFFAAIAGMLDETPALAEEQQTNYNAQTVPLLKAAIHTDPNPAKGGGDIVISEDGALVSSGDLGTGGDVNKYTANGEISVYVVREGDTLSQIAEMYGVSANTILWANEIKKASLIKPGMTLVILPITGVRHVVKEGDTLQSIAKKYEGDLDEIIAYNQLESATDIKVNDTIVVPGGAVSAPAASKSTTKLLKVASRSQPAAAVAASPTHFRVRFARKVSMATTALTSLQVPVRQCLLRQMDRLSSQRHRAGTADTEITWS